ncbi:MAG TPA: class F sortase [Streptosporangiaceae bacterium]|jgi:LPXTG-site transpeptidase (sortase) family protein
MKSQHPGRHAVGVAAGALVIAAFGLAGCGGGSGSAGSAQSSQPAASASAPAQSSGGTKKTLSHSLPVRLDIPRIGVHAPVSTLGLKSDGTIEEPPLTRPNLTGWYRLGPTPGEKGPAVIAGHVDANGGPAVFYKLGQLHRGDQVKITRKDGSIVTFQIDSMQKVPKSAFPTQKVYGDIGFPGIRLITCGGSFDKSTGHYVDNVIAYGHMVSSQA